MRFQVELSDIRPVKALTFSLDLDRNAPLCIVGRNGAGKTTLAKVIMNFALADTFRRTSSDGALRDSSLVRYTLGSDSFEFTYDPDVGTLSTRRPVPESLRSLVAVELPIPHGQRFSYFYALSEADADIRRAIILEDDTRPEALIGFLTRIYGEARFEDLREVKFSRGDCCFYRVEDDRYVREDYFSSGEFFLVNLYRRLQSGPRLIFIDEIDISLDAAAQARLVEELRRLCTQFSVNVVFTSHSLALMQTLRAGELLYLEAAGGQSTLEERSFAFVKSLMFGFRGWDRYILVEDEAAKLVVQYLIDRHCTPAYYSYFVIEVGGAGQVISLLQRNQAHEFLAPADAVIAILDGDQAETGHADEPRTYCMPLWSLESAFEAVYDQPGFTPQLPGNAHAALPVAGAGRQKALYKAYRRYRLRTDADIVELACAAQTEELQAFAEQVLCRFLSAELGAADVEPVAPV
ncbi:MAG TPA: AAA family ATPase [Variovorax sp.]|nr:AAA family ATPase [Variovorax sp.]